MNGYNVYMRKVLHRIDKSTVDSDARTAMCSACGQAPVGFHNRDKRWFCLMHRRELVRVWGKKNQKDRTAYMRDWNARNPLRYAKSMLKHWQKRVDELTSSEAAQPVSNKD